MTNPDDRSADHPMQHASTNPSGRAWQVARDGVRASAAVLACAGALVGCGGAELVLAAFITPLNGTWRLNGDAVGERINFRTPITVHLYNNRYDIAGELADAADRCGAPGSGPVNLEGSFVNGEVVLQAADAPGRPVCISGSFSSLIRFDASATGSRPARFYENSRVDVQMSEGLWVNESGSLRLKFSDVTSVNNDQKGVPIRACDVSPGVNPVVVMSGAMDGFQKATQTRPRIASLTVQGQTAARLSDVEFVNGATIQLRTAAGDAVKLTRQREAAATVCPAA